MQSFTEDELAIAKSVDLVAVAASLGYTPKRIGNYYTLKEMDSMRIYNRSHWCRFSRRYEKGENGGSQIDFLRVFAGMDVKEAVFWLLDFAGYRRINDTPEKPILKYQVPYKEVEKKPYLDPFMDMCNGEILSYGIDKHPSAKNIMDALEQAIALTSDCPYRRTFHSDQGWAYQMKAYSVRLKKEKIFQSMSRKGNCHDNSVMENFFGLLKQEIYYGVVYYSFEELKSEIERYIKYYNEQRIKEKLVWMSPVQYRLSLLAA